MKRNQKKKKIYVATFPHAMIIFVWHLFLQEENNSKRGSELIVRIKTASCLAVVELKNTLEELLSCRVPFVHFIDKLKKTGTQ